MISLMISFKYPVVELNFHTQLFIPSNSIKVSPKHYDISLFLDKIFFFLV